MKNANQWVREHALAVTVVIILGGVFATAASFEANNRAEERQRIEADRAYVRVLRSSCEDRNIRDAKVIAAVRGIAESLGAEPDLLAPLAEALAARDCDATYPMPGEGESPVDPAPTAAFQSCDEARRASATPLYRGEPGYSEALDADGDGIACE